MICLYNKSISILKNKEMLIINTKACAHQISKLICSYLMPIISGHLRMQLRVLERIIKMNYNSIMKANNQRKDLVLNKRNHYFKLDHLQKLINKLYLLGDMMKKRKKIKVMIMNFNQKRKYQNLNKRILKNKRRMNNSMSQFFKKKMTLIKLVKTNSHQKILFKIKEELN